ncbi:MAG: C-terminal binding protein [Slackia sp.]|nr:C-terminal binding protein [Slackia sp.]
MATVAIVGFDFPEADIECAMCENAGHTVRMLDGRSPEFIARHAIGADAIISSYGVFTEEVFAALAPTLRVVSRTGTGYDEIDIAAASAHDVAVCNVPGYGTEVVSDHAIMLALSCLRRVNEQDAAIRRGVWDYAATRPLGQVRGRRFGVVGMGAIGRACARKAAGLGFEVVCWSRSLRPGSCTPEGWKVLELAELARTSDVVSLHTALTPETFHLFDARMLASMKREAVLVNTSRGAVVDTAALAQALREDRLWGAGIDVFESEPASPDDPLLSAPHTVLTPHAAYWSEESGVELRTRACQAAIDVLEGRRPVDCLNPEVLS